jgi:hypothetical protein
LGEAQCRVAVVDRHEGQREGAFDDQGDQAYQHLDRMADIRIDESAHGPADDRTYTYDPTFIMRGLSELHVKFTPVDAVN